jgi:hypothetical protein
MCFSFFDEEQRVAEETHLERLQEEETMSPEQARVRAMILEAQSATSWKENLDTIMEANERFMLPGRQREPPKFVEKMEQRSQRILKQQQEQRRKNKDPANAKFW